MKKLSIKQKKFADEYIITGNATESAIRAGYSENTARQMGNENLTKPYIKSYIDERLAIIDSEKIADQKEVMEYLTRILRDEETEEMIVVEGDGDGYSSAKRVDKGISAKDKIKAAELLGKRYGIWTDKVDMTSNLTLVFEDDYGEEES
ncbi:MAG: terminase small subunit [Tissierellia bacterium]|nr:terminase small subunit [Tissierellia bacterium]